MNREDRGHNKVTMGGMGREGWGRRFLPGQFWVI